MKKTALLVLVVVCATLLLSGCILPTTTYTINSASDSYTITVGDQIDFADYFTITNNLTKMEIPVTERMLDLTEVDLTKKGEFAVTCNYAGATKTITFVVVAQGQGGGADNQGGNQSGSENQGGEEQGGNQSGETKSAPLHDAMVASEDSVGLPAMGSYSALVVPVQFKNGKTFNASDLTNLEIAFNGTESQTGWESVRSYYQESSYGKLNLSFDIYDDSVFTATNDYSYYKTHGFSYQNEKYYNGTDILLKEVLQWLEPKIDLSKYDTNNDGCIDAVYMIYCESVDYRTKDEIPDNEENPSFFWAYVTWYQDNHLFDGKTPYYYFFAGIDFMTENVRGKDTSDNIVDGLKVNACTYIHETGHLLGLDDYYDYSVGVGSDQGLGGADMMDYTVGDHNAYSKTMLGWVTPTVVTETQTLTFTLSTMSTNGGVYLIPLDYDGTYFSEYLLIEFYSATGLNEMHANMDNTYLYGATTFWGETAQYGIKVLHISSSCDKPYSDDYQSFTDNNNSVSDIPLIKLVEADGENNFDRSNGLATSDDLWQTGDSLTNYASHGGKVGGFDITFTSVTSDGATITVTFD